MQSYFVNSVGVIGNCIGFMYASARYIGRGYEFLTVPWKSHHELLGLLPMLLFALGILINGFFLPVHKYFPMLVILTMILLFNTGFLLFELSYGVDANHSFYGQQELLASMKVCLSFLISSMILLFAYPKR